MDNTKPPSSLRERGKTLALLVGVERYDDPRIGALRYSLNDATDLERVLKSVYAGHELTCITLTDLNEEAAQPRKENILGAIEQLSLSASWDDLVYVFLVGHGGTQDGEFYFLPKDARADNLQATAISTRELRVGLEKVTAHHKVLLVDACHSGSGWSTSPQGKPEVPAYEEEFARLGENWAVFASCTHDEVSCELEDEKHGAFTYFVMRGFTELASTAHETLTLSQLTRYVRKELRARLWQTGLPDQSPHLVSAPAGDFPLIPSRGEALGRARRHGTFFLSWLAEALRGPSGLLPAHFRRLLLGTALLLSGVLLAEVWSAFRIDQPTEFGGWWLASAFPSLALILLSAWLAVTAGTAGVREGYHPAGYLGVLCLLVGFAITWGWLVSVAVAAGGKPNIIFCLGLAKDLAVVCGVIVALGLNPFYLVLNLMWSFGNRDMTSVRESLRSLEKKWFFEPKLRIAAASVPLRIYILCAVIGGVLVYVQEAIWLAGGAATEVLSVVLLRDILLVCLCVLLLAWYQSALCKIRQEVFPQL